MRRRLALASISSGSSDCCSKRGFSALLTPLEEFPGTPVTTPTPSHASTTSTTTLPNGLTVISEDTHNTCTISLTYPSAGSYSEHVPSEVGASLVNRYLSLKAGSGLSAAVILRNMEDDGATPFVTSSRYGASVGFTAARDKAVRLVPLLATSSSFERWDVRDAKKSARIEVDEALTSVQTVLTESIYSAAYGAQSSAGKPQYSPTQPTTAAIQSFRKRAYALNGAVLAATGIPDHDRFVQAVEDGFSESNAGEPYNPHEEAATVHPPVFVGGETRVHVPGASHTHLALAFHVDSMSPALGKVAAMCIDALSGGHGQGFSAQVGATGGGLLGAYAGANAAADSPHALDRLCAVLAGPPPSDEAVERVKALAKARAVFQMEDGSKNLAEGLTGAVLDGTVGLGGGFGAEYDAIAPEDVRGVFERMLGGGVPPAIASVGDTTSVPYLGTLASRFS